MLLLLGATIGFLLMAMACQNKEEVSLENRLAEQFKVLLSHSEAHYNQQIAEGGKLFFPRSVEEDGALHYVASGDWCSGFFPGSLWMMSELTGGADWADVALKYTLLMEGEKNNGRTHDMGFKIMGSYGLAHRYSQNEAFAAVVVEAAETLMTRFNPTVGAIRS